MVAPVNADLCIPHDAATVDRQGRSSMRTIEVLLRRSSVLVALPGGEVAEISSRSRPVTIPRALSLVLAHSRRDDAPVEAADWGDDAGDEAVLSIRGGSEVRQ